MEKNKTKNDLPFFGASQYKSRTQVLFHKTIVVIYFSWKTLWKNEKPVGWHNKYQMKTK